MGRAPFVNLSSFTGKQGNTVTILGTHLKGATNVTFNGLAADFKVLSDTYLTATVPAGAATGPIEVTTPKCRSAKQKALHREALTDESGAVQPPAPSSPASANLSVSPLRSIGINALADNFSDLLWAAVT